MNLTINRLPSLTWNHLRMNEAKVTVEGTFENHSPKADFDPAQVLWEKETAKVFPELPRDLKALTEEADVSLAETAPGVIMETPLVLSYAYREGESGASRLILHAGKKSHLKVLMVLTGNAAASAIETEIHGEEDSRVDLYVIELLGEKSLCLNHIAGNAEKNAEIRLIKLELGGERIYAGVNMDLRGNDSRFHSETGYHVKPGQTLDMNYLAVHEGKRTQSLMEVNGTLEETAKKIFRGTIDFRQGCAGAKATENENVMLMADELQNQTIPVILCKEEDVEGNHGASIGQLDEKVLFYLASRGISPEAAQAMIAQARIDAICEKIPVESVLKQVREFEGVRENTHGEEF